MRTRKARARPKQLSLRLICCITILTAPQDKAFDASQLPLAVSVPTVPLIASQTYQLQPIAPASAGANDPSASASNIASATNNANAGNQLPTPSSTPTQNRKTKRRSNLFNVTNCFATQLLTPWFAVPFASVYTCMLFLSFLLFFSFVAALFCSVFLTLTFLNASVVMMCDVQKNKDDDKDTKRSTKVDEFGYGRPIPIKQVRRQFIYFSFTSVYRLVSLQSVIILVLKFAILLLLVVHRNRNTVNC